MSNVGRSRLTMILYWAYGSNLNRAAMARRCPGARPVAPLVVPDAILRFRGVADVAYLRGARCEGALWSINRAHEATLDRYEGVDKGLYVKKYLKFRIDDVEREALYYVMNQVGIMPPDQLYLNIVAQGYRDWGLDLTRLQRALDHSYRRINKPRWLRGRYKRRGMRPFAVGIKQEC